MSPETYVQKALGGDYGEEVRTDAEGAVTDAVEQDYEHDAERVAASLDAMRAARGACARATASTRADPEAVISDAELIAQIMENDHNPNPELEAEAARRWGPNATEYTAQRCSGGKFIPDEVADAVRRDPGAATTWVAVARGQLDPLAIRR